MRYLRQGLWALFLVLLWQACGQKNSQEGGTDPLFELLDGKATGLDFQNTLRPTVDFNVFNYMYFYNGGGLAAEDFNGDGLVDLYFTANMGPNKLYLNRGGLRFEDVTAKAGVDGGTGWKTGATVVDINQDGLPDLYVSQLGDYLTYKGHNLLYVCTGIEDGVPRYAERAAEYGLDLVGFATQAAFFDYDGDGDLDLFQLNHSLHENGTFGERAEFDTTAHPTAGDKLLRNEGGRFVDVSTASGIRSTVIGYGLGLAIGDVDGDGWPDIYIGNDFHENDYLYINQQDGSFREELNARIRHTSRFSMGVDIGDVNGDAQNDLISMDMMPEEPAILKASLSEDPYDIYHFKLDYGYNYQFARNNLQINLGDGQFSEVALYADVYASDWSWAPLLFDFDNDGQRDLFVSNGIPRRMNDIDYVNFRANDELRWKQNFNHLEEKDLLLEEKMPQIKLPNKFFHNGGSLRFQDRTASVRGQRPSYSNGAVYADLDNDGDLDVVVNNIDDAPFIYKNLSRDTRPDAAHYLRLLPSAPAPNRQAIGATAIAYVDTLRLLAEQFPVRGYQSSLPIGLHFGLGTAQRVDSLVLIWPDRSYQVWRDVPVDTLLRPTWAAGLPRFDFSGLRPKMAAQPASDMAATLGLGQVRHRENDFIEFVRQPLMPHMVSAEGPALAVGDADGDGLDDIFIGSAKWGRSRLFFQTPAGSFIERNPAIFAQDSTFEDVDALWADVDGDGDQDLIVASGGNEFALGQKPLKQRIYVNEGRGNFRVDYDAFGETYLTAACVLASDVNGDGLVDVFFGARALPGAYGLTPDSYLFINQGGGRFKDETDALAPGLRQAGLITDGQWADYDGDGDEDLLLAAEWSTLLCFENEGGRFSRRALAEAQVGWWNSLLARDFDGDGDVDLLAGGWGENNKLKPTPEQPIRLYVHDFDNNGQSEPILSYYVKGQEVPFATHADLMKRLPFLKKQFLYASAFAKASLADLFGEAALAASVRREANTLSSYYFERTPTGYQAWPLPAEVQWSTVHAVAFAGNGQALVGGNFDESTLELGRYDASNGHVLRFAAGQPPRAERLAGAALSGKVKHIVPLRCKGELLYVVANNDGPLQVLRLGEQNLLQ